MKRMITIVFVAGLLVACSLFLLTGCSADPKAQEIPAAKVAGNTVIMPTNSPQLEGLTIETIGNEEQAFVPLTGRLVWDDDVTVRVFTPFAGIVRKLMADVGQHVKQGTPLAQLQSADFGQVQADARKAESDFRLAERNLTRLRDLFDHGAAPKKDMDAAEADYERAGVEKARAQSRLAIYGCKDENADQVFMLPSPLDGTIVEKNVTPGQEVRPDQMLANVPQFTAPLFVVSDPRRLWIWLDLTEVQLPLVHKGQELTIRSKAFPDRVFKGRLDLIGDSLDPATRTIRARGSVENPDRLLKAELYVSVEIPDAVPASLQVPSKAVFLRENQHYVFLETSAGRFQRQPVKLGSERNGRVAILDGLKTGQRVVSEGCLLLQALTEDAPKS